jgi:hypothetical protein
MRAKIEPVFALRGPALALLMGTALLGTLLLGCDGDMPRPRYAPQKTAALSQVGYPPPPARVEFIPAQPRGDSVWLDGEWGWTGSKWAWAAGRWVVPPVGATFSPWTTVRDETGIVYFAGGVWNDSSGQRLPPPPSLVTGRSTPGDVMSVEGDSEKTGAPTGVPSSEPAP